MPSHTYIAYIAIVIKVREICAAGANFRFYIGNETGKNDLLFYLIKVSLRLSEVFCKCLTVLGGAKQATLGLWGGGAAALNAPPGSASALRPERAALAWEVHVLAWACPLSV